jgi:UDP:flavonoid glycosyltransferase YjiC (YdhE family)
MECVAMSRPGVAVGRELLRRRHDVRVAVPPDPVGLVGAAGLAAVAYELDRQATQEVARDFYPSIFCTFGRNVRAYSLQDAPMPGRIVA